jgi:hypothetical protein
MILNVLTSVAALATIVGVSAVGTTQTANAADPHYTIMAQDTPPAEPGQPGMIKPEMIGKDMMGEGMRPGMTGGMPMRGARGHMMMKFMFAIADTDGDGALSFEEVMAIHKRIFDKVDANKDGKVTLEEVRAFMRE